MTHLLILYDKYMTGNFPSGSTIYFAEWIPVSLTYNYHTTIMSSIIILTGLSIIGAIIYFIRYKYKKQLNIITTADQAREILKSDQYVRHVSNAWLINTLSIVNPFTIYDKSLLKTFKQRVISILANWCKEDLYEEHVFVIGKRIDYHIPLLQLNNRKLCLSKLVKQVTLDSFLAGVLNVNANDDLLTELPDLIIHLWKNRDDKNAQTRLKELFINNNDQFTQSEIWQQIQTILSDHSSAISNMGINDFDEKISNPLNIIVPGWETMWRVVFYSLLELLRHPKLLEELSLQLNDQSKSPQNCLLLECIIKETLRLYPPTKNIYRTHIKTNEEVRIDIQHIHHNKSVWGSDACTFRPDRFENLTDKQKNHYLPFSISCPARHKFAYIFAGAIITEIIKHCPTFTIADESILPSTDKLLDVTRNSYNDLLILV
ncbi:unnamed protein product [Adineta steineri]|uniref:Cytochrome P450 n=1 Tax=Adineta steineri TaxID=433720 RepID=A0A819PUZ5_9BILA|nr:unnamed protein product [Adineta steineri]CAF4018823.1 unnamed protein product [Adineta steineri]